MPESSSEDKTEQPTQKRLSDARAKGSVAKSTELNSAIILLLGMSFFYLTALRFWHLLMHGMKTTFLHINTEQVSMEAIRPHYMIGLVFIAKIVWPFFAFIAFIGVFANILQVGFLFTTQPLEPNLSKLNPISGLKNLVSVKGLAEAIKGFFKVFIVMFVAYLIIKADLPKIFSAADCSVGQSVVLLGKEMYKIGIIISILILVMAGFDYAFQRWNYMKSMRMTKQEIKEERKQLEGDPLIKSRIKSLQREMARRRMMDEVPKATVVVTNPTFIAIALQYEPDEMNAPKVVAKGKRIIAERIKKIARENDIPIVEDKPLARSLYEVVEPGDEVPPDYFAAVAEILAYVYKLRRKVA